MCFKPSRRTVNKGLLQQREVAIWIEQHPGESARRVFCQDWSPIVDVSGFEMSHIEARDGCEVVEEIPRRKEQLEDVRQVFSDHSLERLTGSHTLISDLPRFAQTE